MNISYISSTELKNNVSEIIDRVRLSGAPTIIEKYGKPVVKIIPFSEKNTPISVDSVMKKAFGALPNFPDVTKSRISRREPVSL